MRSKQNIANSLLILLALSLTVCLFAQDSEQNAEMREGQILLFGPKCYEIVDQSPEYFSDTFEVPRPGQCHLLVLNGIGRNWILPALQLGNRVTSGSICIDGQIVVTPMELNSRRPIIQKPIPLQPGTKTIDTVIYGDPGSFIHVALWQVPPPPPPDRCFGRLVLPYGTIQGENELVLYVRNNNFRHERQFRFIFYQPDGTFGGMSELLTVPASGVLKLRPEEVNTIRPAWEEGSIDIIWMGLGRINLDAYAVQIDPIGRKTVLPVMSYAYPCGEDIE